MTRLELPDDGWADLYAPRKVPERKRHSHDLAQFALNESAAEMPRDPKDPSLPDERYLGAKQGAALKRMTWTLILALVREWSYGTVSEDVLLDVVPGDAYDLLAAHCEELGPQMSPDFGVDVDPKARGLSSPPPPPGSPTANYASATLSPDGTC